MNSDIVEPRPEFKCPYCGRMVSTKTSWCSTCGATVRPTLGKYPISSVWIVMVLLFLPFAISGGCVVENGKYFAEFLTLTIFLAIAGIGMIAYNVKAGRK